MFTCMLAGCLCLGVTDRSQVRNTAPDEPKDQTITVGRLIIVGNTLMRHEDILRVIGIAPGDQVSAKGLRLAKKILTRLGVFKADPELGIRPSITVIQPERSGPRDLLIQVFEPAP